MSDIDNSVWGLRSTETQICIPYPSTQMRVVVDGDWPTDLSDTRTPSRVTCAVMCGSTTLFTAQADLSFQGHFSVLNENKKSLKFIWYNYTTGDDLTVKVGSWLASQKVDMKAYGNAPGYTMDRSLIRDVLCNKIYNAICEERAWPGPLKAPEYVYAKTMTGNSGFPSGALFGCDGFPCEIWQGDTFKGLFIWRTTAPAKDFLVDKSTGDDYLIQANYGDDTFWATYNESFLKISAPKTKKYKAEYLTTLIDYTAGCIAGTSSWDDLSEYADVQSWVDYLIHCELTYNKDGMVNNLYLASWDKQHWYLYPYDMDETIGVYPWSSTKNVDPGQMGFATDEYTMWKSLRGGLDGKLQKRWAELRSSGAISQKSIYNLVKSLTDLMDVSAYQQDVELWGTNSISSIPWVLWWLNGRIAWLDEQWGYSAS